MHNNSKCTQEIEKKTAQMTDDVFAECGLLPKKNSRIRIF